MKYAFSLAIQLNNTDSSNHTVTLNRFSAQCHLISLVRQPNGCIVSYADRTRQLPLKGKPNRGFAAATEVRFSKKFCL